MEKKWFCSRVNECLDDTDTMNEVLNECVGIERDGYKVEQIAYVNGQYLIFYSRKRRAEDEE